MEIRIGEGEAQEVLSELEGFSINGESVSADIFELDPHRYHVLVDGKSFVISVQEIDGDSNELILSINGKSAKISAKDRYAKLLESLGMSAMAETKISALKAPMPGLVLDVLVKEGQEVLKGENLLILEAMKMENVLKSPVDTTIGKIHVEISQSLEKNDLLIDFA